MSEAKEENNTPSEVNEEEKSPKREDVTVDESSKDSDKDSAKDDSAKDDSAKDDSVKEESGKEESGKEESAKGSGKEESDDDDESEEGMGLLDRPVEVTGCRARKKVERLELSFSEKKTQEKHEIPVGRGDKLGDCARIEHQIQKNPGSELKPLHRILFSRIGTMNEVKRNIRKFSGFLFVKDSPEYEKKKAQIEKLTATVLKHMCEVLDIERSGTKDELVNRLLTFLMEPKDSGRPVPKKKSASKDKRKSEKGSSKKPKVKKNVSSDEPDNANENESEDDKLEDDTNDSDHESKKKSKNASKAKKTPTRTKKPEKKEKNKKEDKKASAKRKRDDVSSDTSDDEEEKVVKKTKMPSDDEIKKLVKSILDAADLQEITMKKVIKQVADAYPDCDLSHKKGFIKSTIKSVIS